MLHLVMITVLFYQIKVYSVYTYIENNFFFQTDLIKTYIFQFSDLCFNISA